MAAETSVAAPRTAAVSTSTLAISLVYAPLRSAS
jgi:hypothetical protein